MSKPQYDVIIIGAGPAGLTAGLYTGRAGLSTLILDKSMLGGELMNRDAIENFPGFPDTISGPELGTKMLEQAKKFSAKISLLEVKQIINEPQKKIVRTATEDFFSQGIIIASGSHPKKLGVSGEAELIGRGVFYCATCDGPDFTKKKVVVIGGGDSGLTEALFLSKFVSGVVVIELLPACTATRVLLERALADPKIEIKNGYKIEAIRGTSHVEVVDIIDTKTSTRSRLATDGVLVRIGIQPNTGYFKDLLSMNSKEQIIVDEKMETNFTGIFAAGDVRSNSPCQISSAVGDGATAAISLIEYLEIRR